MKTVVERTYRSEWGDKVGGHATIWINCPHCTHRTRVFTWDFARVKVQKCGGCAAVHHFENQISTLEVER